jgi:hypothetical protein
MTPVRMLILVGGLVVAAASAERVLSNRRDVPAYEELVRDLERQPRAPGASHAALDHARHGLTYLRIRETDRWMLGGYMLDGALYFALGVVMVGFAIRARTA